MSFLTEPIAGPYTCTWGNLNCGLTDQSGFEIIKQVGRQPIQSDQYGPQTRIDDIEIGQSVMIRANFLEADSPGIRALLTSWCGTRGRMAVPGTSVAGDSNKTKQLILTPQWSDSLAATDSLGDVYTANFATLAVDQGVRYALNSQLRIIPVMFVLYPYPGPDGKPIFYTNS